MTNAVLCKMFAAILTEEMPIQIECAMYYDREHPFEVVFMSDDRTDDGNPVEWHYGRDLLAETLAGQDVTIYGEGDVTLFKQDIEGHRFFYSKFQQGERMVLLAFQESDMRTFLEATKSLVPLGEESLGEEFDSELRDLLGG